MPAQKATDPDREGVAPLVRSSFLLPLDHPFQNKISKYPSLTIILIQMLK